MGQSLTLEYDDVELSETAARRLGAFIRELGERDIDDLSLRLEVETESSLEYALSLGDPQPVGEIIEESIEENTSESTGESTSESTEEDTEEKTLPRISPGTNKYAIGAVIYNSDDDPTTREISEALEGTNHDLDVSPISADLYQMHQNGLVERHGSPNHHVLTEDGKEVLERTDAPIVPDPLEEEESADDSAEEEEDGESQDQSQEPAAAE